MKDPCMWGAGCCCMYGGRGPCAREGNPALGLCIEYPM